MGYTTWFEGAFTFNTEVDEDLVKYINKFSDIRHMKRDNDIIKEEFPNWKDLCYNGNLGENGEYFIGGLGYYGEDRDLSVIAVNFPSEKCPGLWCNWIIEDNQLIWNGGEKFYHYIEWLEYLINNFFNPNNYLLNGIMKFQGENEEDRGFISVKNNEIIMWYGDEKDLEEEFEEDEEFEETYDDIF